MLSIAQQHPAIQAYSEASFAFRNRQYQKALLLFQLAERLAPGLPSWQQFRVEQLRYRALCRFYIQGKDNLQQAYALFSQFLQASLSLQHVSSIQKGRAKSLIFQESIAQELAQRWLQKGIEFSRQKQWSTSLSHWREALLWAGRYKSSQHQKQAILWKILKVRVKRNTREDRVWARHWIAKYKHQALWRGYRAKLQAQAERVQSQEAAYHIERGQQWFAQKRYTASLQAFSQARHLLTPLGQESARALLVSLWYWEARCLLTEAQPAKHVEARRKLRQYLRQQKHVTWHQQAQALLRQHEQHEIQRIRHQRQYQHRTAVGWSLLGSGFLLVSVGAIVAGISVVHFQQSATAAINPDSPAEAITEPHRWATTEGIAGWSTLGTGGIVMATGLGFLLSRQKTTPPPQPPALIKSGAGVYSQDYVFYVGGHHTKNSD